MSDTGEVDASRTEVNAGTTHFLPTTSFASGVIPNAPIGGNMIALIGGSNTVDTVTLSSAVNNPVIALQSVGAAGSPNSYDFTVVPTIVTGGPNAEYGGSSIYVYSGDPANHIYAAADNGIVLFSGTFTSSSWTVPLGQNCLGI